MIKTIVALAFLAPMLPKQCQHTAVISDYCANYERIIASRKDTEGTLRQIARENTKWHSVCEAQKK